MNVILLLAMLQGITVNIKPAPEFSVVSESVIVQPKKSEYFERTKARILAMKSPYKHNYISKKYMISDDFYWYRGSFYFKQVYIPLTSDEEYELEGLLIKRNNHLKEINTKKQLEQL